MLSSLLRSKQAVQVSIAIVRSFVRVRRMLATHQELAQAVEGRDQQIGVLLEQVRSLLELPEPESKRRVGFVSPGPD